MSRHAASDAAPAFLTPADVAARLSLSLTAVYALCDAGDLPCHKIGVKRSRRRIDPTDLAAYLERTRQSMPATVQLPGRRRESRGTEGFKLLRAAGWKG